MNVVLILNRNIGPVRSQFCAFLWVGLGQWAGSGRSVESSQMKVIRSRLLLSKLSLTFLQQ